MKINRVLISKIKQMEGSLLGFGLNDNLTKYIDKNDNIHVCNLIDNISKGEKSSGKSKNIKVSKLRKKFKKKRTDYIISNYEIIEKFLDKFITDSIYLAKNKVYIYLKESETKDKVVKKYKRYKTIIATVKCDDGYVLEIDVSRAKNNILKEFLYKILDFFTECCDIITYLLLN